MASEIEINDSIVLARQSAWHGLGTILPHNPTPSEAVRICIPWLVEQGEVTASHNGETIALPNHRANIRSDDRTCLGVVSDQYIPIQNETLARIADSMIHTDGSVEIETGGSLNGGKRVWLLAKMPTKTINTPKGGDDQVPYVFISNRHDGTGSTEARLTMVRVVCANTWAKAMRTASIFKFRHIGMDEESIVHQASQAMRMMHDDVDEQIQFANTLSSRSVKTAEVKQFFLDAYALAYSPVPVNPTTEVEEAQRERAMEGFNKFSARFDSESAQFGTTAWVMANAFTGYSQHERSSRGRNSQQRVSVDVFGTGREMTASTLQLALTASV